MRRLAALALVSLLWAAPARAQLLTAGSLGAANATVTVSPGAILGVTVTVSGTFSGTITFQCDTSGSGTYTAVLVTNLTDGTTTTTTTTTGAWYVPNVSCLSLQTKMTSYTSGTAQIVMMRAYQAARVYVPTFTNVAGTPHMYVNGVDTYSFGPSQFQTNTSSLWNGSLVIPAASTMGWSDIAFGRTSAGVWNVTSVTFASLGTPANGSFAYCSDCTIAATCAGSGTGAFAKRLNGAWVCN